MASSQMHEIVGNIHIHSRYSDGSKYHIDIAHAASEAGIDFIIITDHNVLVNGVEGYYTFGDHQEMVIVGQELHDPRQRPLGNHLLAIGAEQELAQKVYDSSQELINTVSELGGLTFLAHPHDNPVPKRKLVGFKWHNVEVTGFTGIELWNYMSEYKESLGSLATAVRATLAPDQFISGPSRETLALWDSLLSLEQPVVAIGGSDAHALEVGPSLLKKTIFPYKYLFNCVNMHVLLNTPLTGNFNEDKPRVLEALKMGRSWIGYDLIGSTSDFRFSAQGHNFSTVMGGRIKLNYGVTIQVGLTKLATIRFIHNGQLIGEEHQQSHRSFIVNEPGVYRVEVHLPYKGKLRGWIFSTPIYVI